MKKVIFLIILSVLASCAEKRDPCDQYVERYERTKDIDDKIKALECIQRRFK